MKRQGSGCKFKNKWNHHLNLVYLPYRLDPLVYLPPTIWIQKYLKPPSLPTNHLQLRPSAFCCSSDRRHGSFPFRGFPRRSRTWCFSCLESRGSFNVYIYTPRKTNVTGWKTNHLKMYYFLSELVIFSFRGVYTSESKPAKQIPTFDQNTSRMWWRHMCQGLNSLYWGWSSHLQ